MKPEYEPVKAEKYQKVEIDGTWKIGFEEIAKILGDIKGKKILDYGSGTGRSARFLKKLSANVIGVDIDSEMIEKAKELSEDIEFHKVASNGEVPFPDSSFDFALSSFVHGQISDHKKIQKIDDEAYRIIKKLGKYIILDGNSEMWGNEYKSFLTKLPSGFTNKRGDKVYFKLKTSPSVESYDYLLKEEDQIKYLIEAGFKNIEVTRPKPKNDLCEVPPFIVIAAQKK